MKSKKYKMLRVTQEEYDKIKKTRELLLRKGIDNIPDVILKTCPDCGEIMNGVKAEWYQCPKCRYKERHLKATEGIALGTVAATAASVLIYVLHRNFKGL